MSYNLFLDDTRDPIDVYWIKLPSVKWSIVRNYKQFIDTILRDGVPEMISFDHDLANEHYIEYEDCHNEKLITGLRGKINYEKFQEKTGRDCAMWLATYCLDKNIPIPLYYLHSRNGPGCGNMFSILESARKIQEDKINGI